LVIGAVGFVYGPTRAERELAAVMRDVYPAISGQEFNLIRQLVDGRAVSLGVGLVGTLLSATAILGSLDIAISHVLGRDGKRKFVRDRLNGLGFISLVLGLAIVSFALSYGVQAAAGALVGARALRLILEIAGPLVGLGVGYAFFYLVFRLAPRRAIRHRSARYAALVSAVLWEVAKVAFAFLTRTLGTFEAYGSLAFAFGLLSWVYLTAVIILIGAEVIKTADA
jgi:membrane protein